MWFFLALVSALLTGARRTGEKRLLQHTDQFTLGWLIHAWSIPIILVCAPFMGSLINPLHLSLQFWLLLAFDLVAFYPLNTWLAGHALKTGELSKVLPVQSLGPLMSMLSGLIALQQVPTIGAMLAVAIVCFGVYILHSTRATWRHPLRPFVGEKASMYMLASTALVAITVPIDALAIQASNAATYAFASTTGAAAVLFVIARRTQHLIPLPRQLHTSVAALGTMQGASYAAVVLALTTGPIGYISAVKSSGVLFGSILGIVLLHERLTPNKLAAFSCIAFGMVLLAFTQA